MNKTDDSFSDGDPTGPYVFIQWKGTDVCADVHCTCGELFHIDVEYMYFVRCPRCRQDFEVGCFMPIRPVDPDVANGRSIETTGDK